ncbi:MAG: flavin reductase family protein [Rhodobacteraceae bacterium]|nr:flavin reductase family protein [Paracoccaceae bacterium]MCY4138796.1 flavin reductase family protein [Paracoccaceae bacterium]
MRDVLGHFATGVAVVTTCGNDARPVGLAVNSFSSVSLDPPEILWSIASAAPSRTAFERHGAFAVNVMPEEDKDRILQFARPSDNKFDGVPWRRGRCEVPVLDSAIATLECDTKQMIPCGDHHIVVGSVRAIDSRDGNPLVFFRGRFTSLGVTV